MKKIAIFQSDLSLGGIQKSIINMLRNLDYSEYSVDLFLFGRTDDFKMSLPEKVNVTYLDPFPKVAKVLPFELVRRLWAKRFSEISDTYDVAVDFNSYWDECSVGAVTVPAKRRVMWIHNDVEIKLREDKKYKILWTAFKGKFKYFDTFAPVSRGLIPGFCKEAGVTDTGKNFVTIPNYIDTDEIFTKAKEAADFKVDPRCVNLVSVGRLCHQKGYDLLLDIFAEAEKKSDHPIHLYIIGDGPDRETLETKREELDLSDRVTFLGNKPNPFPYVKECDAFVLTSRYEGQGIVIWEAKALGLPVIIPRRLEKYNDGVEGCDDVEAAILSAVKAGEKQFDKLEDYNRKVTDSINTLLGE